MNPANEFVSAYSADITLMQRKFADEGSTPDMNVLLSVLLVQRDKLAEAKAHLDIAIREVTKIVAEAAKQR